VGWGGAGTDENSLEARERYCSTSDSSKRGGPLRVDLSFLIGQQGSPLVGTRQNLTSDE
jgi:hypothetical protein